MPYITRYYSYSNFPMTPMYMYYKTPYMHDRFSGSVEINLSHKSEGAELPPPLQINARSKNKPRTSFPISHNGHPPLEKKYQDPRIFSGVGVGGVVFLLFSFVSYVKYFKLVEMVNCRSYTDTVGCILPIPTQWRIRGSLSMR